MEILQIPALRAPVMLAAFGGWNDAGEAATSAISHLASMWPATMIARVDPEEYYDFQVNRPTAFLDEKKNRQLLWPATEIFAVATPHLPFDLILVKGVEPSMKWTRFTNDLLDLADDLDVAMIITIGSLLADSPHSRPMPVTKSVGNLGIAERLGVEISGYEGPTGILGVLQDAASRRGIDAISLWSAIPHYASLSPSPKATLALVNALEDFLNISLPQGDLQGQAKAWEISIDELASEDSDIGEYVRQLEESKDAADLPEATGESIAREFERYLRRKNTE
jgi:predicted ATP-grasp superfamily ATP-dependent carboligase